MKKYIIGILTLSTLSINAATWYVDLYATNGLKNGTSWANAFTNSPSQTDWTSIAAGDTIYFSGGESGKTYTIVRPYKSGTSNAPITIRPSRESGHDGFVKISSVNVNGFDWITFDGSKVDDFVVPVSTIDMFQITNNIGMAIYDGNGLYGTRFVGWKVKWIEVAYSGDPPTDKSQSGIWINQASLMHSSEIGYCYIHNNYPDGITINGAVNGSPTGWDALWIHHCVVFENVDDGIQFAASGARINNNIIRNKWTAYTSGHPDMLQQTFVSSAKFHCYNNILANTWNAWVYTTLTGDSGKCGDIYFYGNLCYMERNWKGVATLNYGVHFAAWGDNGNVLHTIWTNVYMCNNTIYYGKGEGFRPSFKSDDKVGHALWQMTITNLHIRNNLLIDVSYNSASGALQVSGTTNTTSTNWTKWTENEVVMDNNIVAGANKKITYKNTFTSGATMAAATSYKSNYSTVPNIVSTNTYDFRLLEADTVARNKGADLTYLLADRGLTDINKDLYGVQRGADGGWDIGASEAVSIILPIPPPEETNNVDGDLLVHLKFEDSLIDGIATDSSPGGTNHGIRFGYCDGLTNFPTSVSVTNGTNISTGGKFKYYWDGYAEYNRSGDYIGITNLNAGNVNELTIALWAKYDSAYESDGSMDNGSYLLDQNASLVDSGKYTAAGGWRLGRDNFFSGAQYNNRTKWTIWTNSTDSRLQMSFGDAGSTSDGNSTARMIHYAVVFNRGTNWCYRDGVQVSSNVCSVTSLPLNTRSHWLAIGAWPHHGTVVRDGYLTNTICTSVDKYPNTFWMNGKMDDVRIYSRALSVDEIVDIVSGNTNVVIPPPTLAPTIAVQPVNTIAVVGESASFSIEADGDSLTYQWYKDDDIIDGATSTIYSIPTLQMNDEGTFYCIVINSAGSVTSDEVTLTVLPLRKKVRFNSPSLRGQL